MKNNIKTKRNIKRIVCIQLSGVFPDFCHRLIMPDYGMPLIGTILAHKGYDVQVFMEHVEAPDWESIKTADIVCMSTLSAGASKTYILADRIREQIGIPVILGGTHATYFPELCLQHCDYVVLGEGDETIISLVQALSEGGNPTHVPGIAYKNDDSVIYTQKQAHPASFDTIPDFRLIHGYEKLSSWEILKQRRLPLMTIQSTRGCPFSCKYCIVDTMFDSRYATRSIDSVIADLRDKRQYGKELLFVDNNFGSHRAYTKQLLNRMIEEDMDFDIMVLTRTNIAQYDDLLELMRLAGITQLYQGYESIEADALDAYDKHQTIEKINRSIRKLHSFGFRLSGSFIFGADTDTVETIHTTVEYVLQQRLSIAYFFPLWGHYAERKNNYSSLIPRHRSIFRGWEYCDGNFVSHFPMRMRPSELQREIIAAHRKVFAPGPAVSALFRGEIMSTVDKLTHRWMWATIERETKSYISWLEELEEGLYDEAGQLDEKKLLARSKLEDWPLFPVSTQNLRNTTAVSNDKHTIHIKDVACQPA